ncbi:MAG TPA: HAD family acid phosphatase, partial [Chitinophagaceae bacterium]|nr:HAD family acid phosphatase [Chitinophagaceae bacterium]
AYDVHQSLQGKDYEQVAWNEWTARSEADTVPGALTFFKYAASKGIRIYFISNRGESERTGTLQNLIKFGFPDASNDHLLLRQTTSGKEIRRQQVMNDHDVLLLFGDNLSDFSDLFDKKPYEERLAATRRLTTEFGNRFIVLPNPAYGDWELSLYQFKSLNLSQKDSAARHWLKSY